VETTAQLRHLEAGGDIYHFEALKAAAVRHRQGKATAEDERQLSMLRPGRVENLLHMADIDAEDARRVRLEIRRYGVGPVASFYGSLGQLAFFRRLGVSFSERHSRCPRAATSRRRGSRRSVSSRTGPDGDPDEPEPHKGDVRPGRVPAWVPPPPCLLTRERGRHHAELADDRGGAA
jgi:hypothetical protein